MPWQKKLDIVILILKYDPTIVEGTERATMVEKTSYVKGSFSRVKHWFNNIMVAEVPKVSPRTRPHFKEWEISTSNREMFMIDGIDYCKAYVIFGEDKVHWIYYSTYDNEKRLSGSDDITFGFCGCCLRTQYEEIMGIIQDSAMRKLIQQRRQNFV